MRSRSRPRGCPAMRSNPQKVSIAAHSRAVGTSCVCGRAAAHRTCVRNLARLSAMSLIVQPSLFGSSGSLGLTELGGAVERRPLSDGAWVDLRPGFVTAADELFDALATAVPWREERMH